MRNLTADTINLQLLKRTAGQVIYERGEAYYVWGRVEIEEVLDDVAYFTVQGSDSYEVVLELGENELYMDCTCPYAANLVICKHEVAAALALREYLQDMAPAHWSDYLDRSLQLAPYTTKPKKPKPYLLFFSLQQSHGYTNAGWKITPYSVPYSRLPEELQQIGADRNLDTNHVLRTYPSLLEEAKTITTTLNLEVCLNCRPESVVLANMLVERGRSYPYMYSVFPLNDYLELLNSTGSPLFLGSIQKPLQRQVRILNEPGELCLELERLEAGIQLQAHLLACGERIDLPALQASKSSGQMQVISRYPRWFLADRTLIKLSEDLEDSFLYSWLQNPSLFIPTEEEGEFLEKYYLRLAEGTRLQGEPVTWEQLEIQPVKRLYLSEESGKLQAELRFGYGELEVGYAPELPEVSIQHRPDSWTLVRVRRAQRLEEDTFSSLSSSKYRLKRAPKPALAGQFVLRANAHPIDFLFYSVPRLLEDGFEIYGEERLKSAHVNRNTPTLSFNVSSGIDWFDVQAIVSFGDVQVSLKEIRKALRKKERYVKLADGSIGQIPEEWLERYRHLFALGKETEDGLRLSNHHLGLLEDVLEGAQGAQVDAEFRRRLQTLRHFSEVTSTPIPNGFLGELRPYQKAGYDWLHFLRQYGFGGCLADDMGLGKTIQVLVFFQSLKEGYAAGAEWPGNAGLKKRPAASLVVVPRSLLANWQREAQRFTPDLSFLEYFNGDRPKDPESFDDYDLVITTYGIVRRDIGLLRKYNFQYVVLDESQAVKNPISQTARACRKLQCGQRLALTGTPVENSTVELWSLFSFLNPGLLGDLEFFKREFGGPIERKNDLQAAKTLRKTIYPFILRRTKTQVAPELPPRSERIVYCDMQPAQRKLYERTRDRYRSLLMGMIEDEGMQNARMKILEGLLRLRQVANHPSLTQKTFRGASGKFELLLETLETLQSEGHKALVFSQFVQMLKLVRKELDKRKVPYTYLDGHTRNRQEQVDRFQEDPKVPLFLISLKAGGVGLNLTAADYVIHIDPWWNPAVEMQATDRTHRIGQDKPVFVYKLISRDTVEEKILLLQERKRDLVDQIITTESGFFKDLSQEDVRVLFS